MIGLKLCQENSQHASTRVYQNKDESSKSAKENNAPNRKRAIVDDCQSYRNWLDEMIIKQPELFPKNISAGYILHDGRSSAKLEGVRLRHICLKARDAEGKKQGFTIAPSAVMPYFVGLTDKIEKALFLRTGFIIC